MAKTYVEQAIASLQQHQEKRNHIEAVVGDKMLRQLRHLDSDERSTRQLYARLLKERVRRKVCRVGWAVGDRCYLLDSNGGLVLRVDVYQAEPRRSVNTRLSLESEQAFRAELRDLCAWLCSAPGEGAS